MNSKLPKNKKMSRATTAPDIFILPVSAQKKLPNFAIDIFNILVKQFPKTYIIGGAVRNILLKEKVRDLDIATSAKPDQVEKLLKKNHIPHSSAHKKFGVIVARSSREQTIEIATFRAEVYGKSRFPKVTFIPTPKQDSLRRDFSINALYYSLEANAILDFHDGLDDILNKKIKFIGNAKKRILEDPLRIVRAYRFALQYNLSIDKKTETLLQTNKHLLKKISSARIKREINSLTPKKLQKTLQKVIHSNT